MGYFCKYLSMYCLGSAGPFPWRQELRKTVSLASTGLRTFAGRDAVMAARGECFDLRLTNAEAERETARTASQEP